MAGKFGRRPPTNAPAMKLGDVLSGLVPVHPPEADYLAPLSGWKMLGNDQWGDCVAVTEANLRRLITHQAGHEFYMSLDQVLEFYKTQNPDFPDQDEGMVIQDALNYLLKTGGPDGVKAVAFAKVDYLNESELDAALAIFGGIWVGVNVIDANMDEFDNGQPWDYISGSPLAGGHSVLTGGYQDVTTGGDIQFITWAEQTSFTDRNRTHLWEEAWVVIWPEHWTMMPFLTGIDQQKLADAYHELTGKTITPPTPGPLPPDPIPPVPRPASWWSRFWAWLRGLFS